MFNQTAHMMGSTILVYHARAPETISRGDFPISICSSGDIRRSTYVLSPLAAASHADICDNVDEHYFGDRVRNSRSTKHRGIAEMRVTGKIETERVMLRTLVCQIKVRYIPTVPTRYQVARANGSESCNFAQR